MYFFLKKLLSNAYLSNNKPLVGVSEEHLWEKYMNLKGALYVCKKSKGHLFVVVGLVAEYGHGAVYLLYKEETYHLMGKGHLAQGDFSVGACINRL